MASGGTLRNPQLDHLVGQRADIAESTAAATVGSRASSVRSESIKDNVFHIYPQGESEVDKLITQALVLGDFASAVDLCLASERFADALLLAVRGGAELLQATQKAYFARRTTSLPFLRVFQSIVTEDLADIVQNADLGEWKVIFVVICTFAKEAEFNHLAEQLGTRLQYKAHLLANSSGSGDHKATSRATRQDATLCFLAARRLEKVVTIWAEEMREEEQAAVDAGKTTRYTAHALALQSFIEKVAVFSAATGYVDVDLLNPTESAAAAEAGARTYRLAGLYDRYYEYADLLATQGLVELAARYAQLTPTDYKGSEAAGDLEQARDRLLRAAGAQDSVGARAAAAAAFGAGAGAASTAGAQQTRPTASGYAPAPVPAVPMAYQPQVPLYGHAPAPAPAQAPPAPRAPLQQAPPPQQYQAYQPSQPAQPPQPAPSAYAPSSQPASYGYDSPYAPAPGSQSQQPQQQSQSPYAPSGYGAPSAPNGYQSQAQGYGAPPAPPPQQTYGGIPPPPRNTTTNGGAGANTPPLIPASQRRDLPGWNDAPSLSGPPKRPASAVNKEAKAAPIMSPFPNAEPAGSYGFGSPAPPAPGMGGMISPPPQGPPRAAGAGLGAPGILPPPPKGGPRPPSAQNVARQAQGQPQQQQQQQQQQLPPGPPPQAQGGRGAFPPGPPPQQQQQQAPPPRGPPRAGPPPPSGGLSGGPPPARALSPLGPAGRAPAPGAPAPAPVPISMQQGLSGGPRPPSAGPPPPGRAGPPPPGRTGSAAPPQQQQQQQQRSPVVQAPSQVTSPPPPAAPAAPVKASHPAGDRSHIPETSRPAFESLSRAMDKAKAQNLPPHVKRIVDDTERRLGILFDAMNNEAVGGEAMGKVDAIAKSIAAADLSTALALHVELLTVATGDVASWAPGLKQLIRLSV